MTIPTAIPVQRIEETWEANGPKADKADWDKRFDVFFDELEWYARALKAAREASASAKP